jgi:hypothetical protein
MIVVVPAPLIVTVVPLTVATFVLLLVHVRGRPELLVTFNGIVDALPYVEPPKAVNPVIACDPLLTTRLAIADAPA